MQRRRVRRKAPLTPWDRLVYGAITAAFGALLGLGASLCLVVAFPAHAPVRWIVLASAGYFALIGWARGADAASFTGEALVAVGAAAMAEAGANPGRLQNPDGPWSAWSSPVLTAGWLAVVGLLAWKG